MDNKAPVLKEGTTPLPYVQTGMALVDPREPDIWWVVSEILGPAPCTATLTAVDFRRVNLPCPEVRERFQLYCDFDPEADYE